MATHPTDKYEYNNDGTELTLQGAEPHRRFDNMLYNRAIFTIIDQSAGGQCKHMKNEYTNNIVAFDRLIYVRDDTTGQYFSVGYRPVFKQYQSYRCTSGLNYQIIENITDGIKATWRIFVPTGCDPVEIWDLKLEDTTGKERKLSVFTCVPMPCDGVDTYGGPMFRFTDYYKDANAIFVRADAEKFSEIDFPLHNGFFTADRTPTSYEACLDNFIGKHRTLHNPAHVEKGSCDNNYSSMWLPTGTFHFAIQLPAGKPQSIRMALGACENLETIKKYRDTYMNGNLDACSHFDALKKERAETLANISVETPEDSVNKMLNTWGKQQLHYLSTWCRWGYKGYRDIVQNSQGVLYWDTALARKNLLDAFGHQYSDGFALRGWHPLDPMRYVDSASWLIHAISEYLKETGDFDILDQIIPYLDEGQDSVYDHLMKTMHRLHTDRGAHGLCLAFFGDWNDSLTGVCKKGKGESVWMSMAFCRCALEMAELAHHLKKPKDAELMRTWQKEMAHSINTHAWDGNWYICALDDNADPIGSKKNEEGKIFLNMQSWAQLGQVCDDSRWQKSIDSVDKHLDTKGWGPTLNWPAYTKPDPRVGRLSYLRPGIAENATVYTHGAAFLFLAYLERNLPDQALKLWQDVHPGNLRRPWPCQSNVFVNGFRGPASDIQPGEAEHAWTTGSASWMILAAIEHMIGLRRCFDGIRIQPNLPSAWKNVTITRHYRNTTYNVTMTKQTDRPGTAVKSITIDGKAQNLADPLPIDNAQHNIHVTVE